MAEKSFKDIEAMTYKEAASELEMLVRALEQGELELEDAIDSYTRGVELLKNLRHRLDTAEQKVSNLMEGGELVEGSGAAQRDTLS